MNRLVLMSKRTLKVSKIRNGTVIDHIARGRALDVIKILGIDGRSGGVVTIAMNVPSKKLGTKDMVKIEGRYKVVEKQKVKLPPVVQGIVRCIKPSCISNSKSEPVKPTFYVEQEDPLRLRCHYCNNIIEEEDVLKQF